MDGLIRIQSEHLGGGRSGRKGARRSAGVKAAAELRGAAGHADTAADFIARHYGSEQPLAVDAADMADQRVRGWYGFRTGVNDSDTVQIVHLKAMNQRAVGQRRAGAGNLGAVRPNERPFASAQFLGE